MNILGISAFYHDSAACLIRDGEIIFAAQEERFTRKKHDFSFPKNAVNACFEYSNLDINKIDYVSFYEKPFLKFERILQSYLQFAPHGFNSFIRAIPQWIKKKLWIKENIRNDLKYDGRIIFPEHHQSHAASAFFPSPFGKSAILTIDGVGEWTTTSYGEGENNKIKIDAELQFPHSLGLLYSAFTYYTGFKVNSGEYKLMGLAPYGEPKYKDLILNELIDLKDDGSFKLNLKYFDYCAGLRMINKNFNKLFGAPSRKPESPLTQHYMDVACSVQKVTEEIILRISNHIYNETGQKNLCLAGGVALNCVSNGRIFRETPFEKIWIQPAAGDAGGAVGAALFTWYQYLDNERKTDNKTDFMKGAYLGPEFNDDEISEFLKKNGISFKKTDETGIIEKTADLLNDGKVVGWFQGRMELGPRALGNRSILGDARSAEMQKIINLKIKFRESFRPFAPSVLLDKCPDYFELNEESPYMLLVAEVKNNKKEEILKSKKEAKGLDKLKLKRSDIPAVTHVDYSARIQTVDKESNPMYYNLINRFYKKYGCPVVINTSFNVRGEPIVCSLQDAYSCFLRTNMDYLVIGNYLLAKEKQKYINADKNYFELD